MGNALPLRLQFLRRPASHHFSQYFAHQPSSSLERRPRGGRKAHGHPGRALFLGGEPTLPRPTHLSQPPGGNPGARTAAPSRAPGSAASAGAERREATAIKARIKSRGNRNPNAPLTIRPPDNILQKRVLRGHQSPPAPGHGHPPDSSGSGGVPARLLTAAASGARGPRAIPTRSAPCAPRGPGRSGAAAPSGCHPRALFAPPSLRPASQCTRAGSPRRSRLRVGGGSRGAWAGGAPYRARAPRGPAGDRAEVRRPPGGRERRWGRGCMGAPPSGQMAFRMFLGRFLGLTPNKVTVSFGIAGCNSSFALFQAGASGTSEALGTPSCFPLGILSLICASRPTFILKPVVN